MLILLVNYRNVRIKKKKKVNKWDKGHKRAVRFKINYSFFR